MMDKKKLSMLVAVAVVATGTAIGITGLAGGTARAQPTASITITGMAQAGTTLNPEVEVLVSVTCPASDIADVSVTAVQGGFYKGSINQFTCTGNPQNETIPVSVISGTSGNILAGPVSAGASMLAWVRSNLLPDPSNWVGTTATVTYP